MAAAKASFGDLLHAETNVERASAASQAGAEYGGPHCVKAVFALLVVT